ISSEIRPGREIPARALSLCCQGIELQRGELLPVRLASRPCLAARHPILDLVSGERFDIFPTTESGFPLAIKGIQIAILCFEPFTKCRQRNWIEVVIKRIGR